MSSPGPDSIVPVPMADANEESVQVPGTNDDEDTFKVCDSTFVGVAVTMADADGDRISGLLTDTNKDNFKAQIKMIPFSRPASVAGSDDSNTAAGSDVSDRGPSKATIVPYTGPFGSGYTQDTPPKDFSDWPVYLSFCEDGPTLRIECVNTVNEHGIPDQFNEMYISTKLLCDYSEYFRTLYRIKFEEAMKGRLQLVDILHEEMMRLKLILMSGSYGRMNLGKEEEEMSNLVRMFELADRFRMPEIADRIKARTIEFVRSHCNWKLAYQLEVVDAPSVSILTTAKENFHRAKVLDFSNAYTKLAAMPSHIRVVCLKQLAAVLAECCPPALLRCMMRRINHELAFAIMDTVLLQF